MGNAMTPNARYQFLDSFELFVALGIAALLTSTQIFTVSKHLSEDGLTHTYLIYYLLGVDIMTALVPIGFCCRHHGAERSTRVPFA